MPSFGTDLDVTTRSKARTKAFKRRSATKIQAAIRGSLARRKTKASATRRAPSKKKRRSSHLSRVAR